MISKKSIFIACLLSVLIFYSVAHAQTDISVTVHPILIPSTATNGLIQVDVSSTQAPAPYTYLLLNSNGGVIQSTHTTSPSHQFTVTQAGNYCVDVIDDEGCRALSCFDVIQCRVESTVSGHEVSFCASISIDINTEISPFPFISGGESPNYVNQYNFETAISPSMLHVIEDTTVMGHIVRELEEILSYDSSQYSIHYQEEYVSYNDFIFKFEKDNSDPQWIHHEYGNGAQPINLKSESSNHLNVISTLPNMIQLSSTNKELDTNYDLEIYSSSGILQESQRGIAITPNNKTTLILDDYLAPGLYFIVLRDRKTRSVQSSKFIVYQR